MKIKVIEGSERAFIDDGVIHMINSKVKQIANEIRRKAKKELPKFVNSYGQNLPSTVLASRKYLPGEYAHDSVYADNWSDDIRVDLPPAPGEKINRSLFISFYLYESVKHLNTENHFDPFNSSRVNSLLKGIVNCLTIILDACEKYTMNRKTMVEFRIVERWEDEDVKYLIMCPLTFFYGWSNVTVALIGTDSSYEFIDLKEFSQFNSSIRQKVNQQLNKLISKYFDIKKKEDQTYMDEPETESEWHSLGDWYGSESGIDDITEYGQKLEQLVMKKYPSCKYFEEPSTQGTQGSDIVSVEIDNDVYHFDFDWETLLESIFTDGPESAAKDSFNEIVKGITTESALVSEE